MKGFIPSTAEVGSFRATAEVFPIDPNPSESALVAKLKLKLLDNVNTGVGTRLSVKPRLQRPVDTLIPICFTLQRPGETRRNQKKTNIDIRNGEE